MEYFAIDFETANDYQNSACSVGVVRFVDGEENDSVYSLIKPAKMYFRPDFIDIHEISYGDVRNSPQFSEVWQTIIEPFLKKSENEIIYFIAHNALADSQTCGNFFLWQQKNWDVFHKNYFYLKISVKFYKIFFHNLTI